MLATTDTVDDFVRPALFTIGVLALLFGLIGVVIRSAIRGAGLTETHDQPDADHAPDETRKGFEVLVPVATAIDTDDELPGTFEVVGVDKESLMDCRQCVSASSAANARIKAELTGMVVSRVRRLPQ